MPTCGWDNCHPDVRRQVQSTVAAVTDLLAGNLRGIYLHGSLAMGCFNPARSDVDLLILMEAPMAEPVKRKVGETLLALSSEPAPFEVSFLSQGDLVPWRYPTPYDFHFSEDWRQRFEEMYGRGICPFNDDQPRLDPDLAGHITVTRHRGVSLHGVPAAKAFPPVPVADFVRSLLADLEWSRERFDRIASYAILNACRTYAYLCDGRIRSKLEGADWALQSMPEECRPAIARARDIYQAPVREDMDPDQARRVTQLLWARIRLLADPILTSAEARSAPPPGSGPTGTGRPGSA